MGQQRLVLTLRLRENFLAKSQVIETVKKQLKDSESGTTKLDRDTSTDKECESDCDFEDVSSDSDEFGNSVYAINKQPQLFTVWSKTNWNF